MIAILIVKSINLFFFTVLQKAGRHMEHTLIGAYVVLLLGYLIMDNKVKVKLITIKMECN